MIDKKLTAWLAKLSRIEFADSELEEMTDDMRSIIALMDKVREFDGTESPYALNAVDCGALRADESKEQGLGQGKSFTVPKVV